MSTNAVCFKVDEKGLAAAVQQVQAQLNGDEGEVALDLSAVRRIGTGDLKALEALAGAAGGKHVAIALRGVNVDVYKVLKVARLASRFTFPI